MIDKHVRKITESIGKILIDRPTSQRLGSGVLACGLNSDEKLAIYKNIRPEIYGRLVPLVVRTVNYTCQQADNRTPYGFIISHKGVGANLTTNSFSWESLYTHLHQTLSQDADELFFSNDTTKNELVEPLNDLLQCASSNINGAHNDARVAFSYGIGTALSSAIMLTRATDYVLNDNESVPNNQHLPIMLASHKLLGQIALANLAQVEALSCQWVSYSNLANDLTLSPDRSSVIFRYGAVYNKPITEKLAKSVSSAVDKDYQDPHIKDLETPFGHIGCPITIVNPTVKSLWQWVVSSANSTGLINVQ